VQQFDCLLIEQAGQMSMHQFRAVVSALICAVVRALKLSTAMTLA